MPSIITDDMVKELCAMSRPIPMKAMAMLDTNKKVGSKPNYVKNKGRSGIRYTDRPSYAPASVGSLAQSICNITKIDVEEVENYLENRINDEVVQFNTEADGGGNIMEMVNPEDVVFDPYDIPDVPPDIENAETQTRGQGRPPRFDEGTVIYTDPSRFESAGDVDVEYCENQVNMGEDTQRGRGRPRGDTTITPRLRGSESRRADGEPEL